MAPAVHPCSESRSALDDVATPHVPAHAWSFRCPSPPRIVVPPPRLDHHGIPDSAIGPSAAQAYEPSDTANADFLKAVTYGDFSALNNILDWKYEQRRMAQKILPFLFLGPMTAARDKQFLKREGITMLLAVRNTMSAQARLLNVGKIASDLGLHSATVDVAGNQELIAAFPRAIQEINNHMQHRYSVLRASLHPADGERCTHTSTDTSAGKVLVFCESGNERSAAVVAAYLITMYNMDFIRTIQVIQAQRFCVAFDESSKALLQTYAAMVQAKRDVARSGLVYTEQLDLDGKHRGQVQHASVSTSANRGKRNLDEAYSTDVEMGNTSGHFDDERFEERGVSPPFQDGPSL